jgi:predicted DCC family thiol-disulfide oxidoreductase YuxK
VPGDGVQTIVLLNVDGQIYTRSDAVLMMVGHFGGPYRLAGALWLVPRIARDVVYRLISRYRYALFGQRVTCRMPVADEQSVFLDAANTSGI